MVEIELLETGGCAHSALDYNNLHGCPYQADVNDDPEYQCNCCEECEQNCCDEI